MRHAFSDLQIEFLQKMLYRLLGALVLKNSIKIVKNLHVYAFEGARFGNSLNMMYPLLRALVLENSLKIVKNCLYTLLRALD